MSNLFYEQLEKQSNGTDLKEFAIAELEAIKEEILTQNPKFTIGCEMKMCLEIIDYHISELKGEKK